MFTQIIHKRFDCDWLFNGKNEDYPNPEDEQAREQLNIYIEQMAKMQNVTEELKAYDPKCWVQAMNNIKENAEESVLREVVYQ